MKLTEFIEANIQNVRDGKAEKIEAVTEEGEVKMYSCGSIIRIDVKK